jgi:trk system potassium uptake protein TrkA
VHFVIMGCGRVGSTLAHILESQGHTVAIIDAEESAFRRLGQGFAGRRVTGIGFDRDTLREAGIEDAHAFAAVSSGDNSTVATVRWTADQMMRRLLPHGSEPEWRDPSGTIRLAEVPVDSAWVGERISRLEIESGGRVAFLTRLGEGLLPGSDTVLQDGDIVHVIMRDDDADAIESVFRRRSTTPAEGGA